MNVGWNHSSDVSFVPVDTNRKVNCRYTLARSIQISSLVSEVVLWEWRMVCMCWKNILWSKFQVIWWLCNTTCKPTYLSIVYLHVFNIKKHSISEMSSVPVLRWRKIWWDPYSVGMLCQDMRLEVPRSLTYLHIPLHRRWK